MVEVLSHYSNTDRTLKPLVGALTAARTQQRTHSQPPPRQRQHRLDERSARELADAYEAGGRVTELASRFCIHRGTVTAILRREGVTLRPVGLSPADIPLACQLYRDGWSLARLGEKFGVDGMTIRAALRAKGVVMRSPNERRSRTPFD